MLTGPCALTMPGAATVVAAPAAATFRKRRRVEVSSFVGVVMALLLPAEPVLGCTSLYRLAVSQRLAGWFGKIGGDNATLRRAHPHFGDVHKQRRLRRINSPVTLRHKIAMREPRAERFLRSSVKIHRRRTSYQRALNHASAWRSLC